MANQVAAIAAYAARRNLSVVQTYWDQGRSGVKIAGRDGLQRLIRDVQSKSAAFDCILVYDVSRWGRFQDVDESAYYEFICRHAGINVHYCADEFENDGSLASVILKNVKRVNAANYSRQLSKKVFLGQSRVAALGHWRGGPPGYGLRRMLVDENGKPKMLLSHGQRKGINTEHVVLVPGPRSETRIVRWIFTSFAIQKLTTTEIAAELNSTGSLTARGKPWSSVTIRNMLKNEVYLGHLVFNRRSQKINEKQVANPQESWVRRDHASKPIVSPKLFSKAQDVLAKQQDERTVSDKELLDALVALLRKKGRLSMKIMKSSKELWHWSIYARRFGSVPNAYKRIGFNLAKRYRYAEAGTKIDTTIRDVAADIIAAFGRRRTPTTFAPERKLLTIDQRLTVGMAVAKSVAKGNGVSRPYRWQVRKLRSGTADLTLIVRMNPANTAIKDYFLIPVASLPMNRDDRVCISGRLYAEFGYGRFDAVLKAITNRLRHENAVVSERTL